MDPVPNPSVHPPTEVSEVDEPRTERLRYPVGRFAPKASYPAPSIQKDIAELEHFPGLLAERLTGSDVAPEWRSRRYRKGSWTGKQIVHHLVDSHVSGLVRTMMAITDPGYVVQPYDQDAWVWATPASLKVEESIELLRALHRRWCVVLRSLPAGRFGLEFGHPEWETLSLGTMLQLYVWHGRHHLGHLEIILEGGAGS